MRLARVEHRFVEVMPDTLEPGVLYVSMEFALAMHLCACGCGEEVVTPFSPAEWRLTFDGETVSLDHSIGNWSFHCQSHYWITENRVLWGKPFSRELIARVRANDAASLERYHSGIDSTAPDTPAAVGPEAPASVWQRLLDRWRRRS